MVKSMYAGVAGLKAHQSKMDVIGNNIANVNTWGYKGMSTSFKESIYQTLSGGSSGSTGDGGLGGTNPSMVGYGSMVSAISANFTTGTSVPTGRALDVFIDGTAFFAVGPIYGSGDAKKPSDLNVSRVGDFGVINNYLVDGNGRYVYGSSMATGGEVYFPGTVVTKDYSYNVKIPDGTNVPKDTTKKTETGTITTSYTVNSPNDGKMTVTTTIVESKSMEGLLGLHVKTSDADLKKLVEDLNKKSKPNDNTVWPKVTYELANNNEDVIITTTQKGDLPATAFGGLAGGDLTTVLAGLNLNNAADVQTAIDRANAAASLPANTTYKVDPFDPLKVCVVVTPPAETARTATGTGSGVPGATLKSSDAAIAAALALPTGAGYTRDPGNPNNLIKTTVETEIKNIPLPKGTSAPGADDSTVTISYEDNGANDGTCTMVTTTSTPAAADAPKKGPTYDDGRMAFDEATGKYTLVEGTETLRPLKLPTTCTYYDENGDEQTEENVTFGTFKVEADGSLYGTSTTTKRTYLLGSIALVNVPNPSGMSKSDGPYYTPGGSSGEATIIQAGSTTGKLKSECLESANVDIATEFSEMITTQRGFQANSKIITVTDEMLQELVNMKR